MHEVAATAGMWRPVAPECRQAIMWGAADQARVNRPILEDLGVRVVALVDDTPGLASPFPDVPLYEGWTGFERWAASARLAEVGFVVAIGNPYGHVRVSLHARLVAAGLAPLSFADRTALISSSATIGPGLQVMPQAIVHHHADVHRQVIVNTRALVEHDCVLEEGVELAPGAVLCGRVHVGAHTWIGAGAVVRPRVRIGRNTIIGAGAAVVGDIPDGVIAVGVPARVVADRVTPSAAASAAGFVQPGHTETPYV